MDVVTLALAKQYADSQRIAYEEGDMFYFDGNITGLEAIDVLVRVSDKSVDLRKIKSVQLVTVTNGEVTGTDTFNKFTVEGEGLVTMLIADETGAPYVVNVSEDYELEGTMVHRGFYVFAQDLGFVKSYVSCVDMKTIHPIDPKYIPALDSITLNGADGKQYKLAINESGTLVATPIE